MGRKKRQRKRRQPNPQQQSFSPSVDVEGKLQQAISLQQVGQLQQAEQICQQILIDNSQHADALHLLGVIACQVEEYKIATDSISRAVEIDSNQSQPQFAGMYNNLGNALLGQRKVRRIDKSLSAVIHIQPDDVAGYSNLIFAQDFH